MPALAQNLLTAHLAHPLLTSSDNQVYRMKLILSRGKTAGLCGGRNCGLDRLRLGDGRGLRLAIPLIPLARRTGRQGLPPPAGRLGPLGGLLLVLIHRLTALANPLLLSHERLPCCCAT